MALHVGLCLVLLAWWWLHQREPVERRESTVVGGSNEDEAAAPLPAISPGEQEDGGGATVTAAASAVLSEEPEAAAWGTRPASGGHVSDSQAGRSVRASPSVGVGDLGEEERRTPVPAVVTTCSEGGTAQRKTPVSDQANLEALEGDGVGPPFSDGLQAAREEKAVSETAAAGKASAGEAENLEQEARVTASPTVGLLEREEEDQEEEEEEEEEEEVIACAVSTGSDGDRAEASSVAGLLTFSNEREEERTPAAAMGPDTVAGGFEEARSAPLAAHVSGGKGAGEGARQTSLSWTVGVTTRGLEGACVWKSCPELINLTCQHEEVRQTTVTPTEWGRHHLIAGSRGKGLEAGPRKASMRPALDGSAGYFERADAAKIYQGAPLYTMGLHDGLRQMAAVRSAGPIAEGIVGAAAAAVAAECVAGGPTGSEVGTATRCEAVGPLTGAASGGLGGGPAPFLASVFSVLDAAKETTWGGSKFAAGGVDSVEQGAVKVRPSTVLSVDLGLVQPACTILGEHGATSFSLARVNGE